MLTSPSTLVDSTVGQAPRAAAPVEFVLSDTIPFSSLYRDARGTAPHGTARVFGHRTLVGTAAQHGWAQNGAVHILFCTNKHRDRDIGTRIGPFGSKLRAAFVLFLYVLMYCGTTSEKQL